MKTRERAVQRLFTRIAHHYALLNTVLSLGLHKWWRRAALRALPLRPTGPALDLCAGTGDFTLALLERGWPTLACDLTLEMLQVARKRCSGELPAIVGNALALPVRTGSVALVTNGFGLRQCEEDLGLLLSEVRRVLRPGGLFVVLELSHPRNGLWRFITNIYIRLLIPLVGSLVDRDAYYYLSRSLHNYPDAPGLRSQLLEAGFAACEYHLLTGGVAALHVARVASEANSDDA